MQEKTIIYGITNFGLLFVPESTAKELADGKKELLDTKNEANSNDNKLTQSSGWQCHSGEEFRSSADNN